MSSFARRFKEMIERLRADDWARVSTEDEKYSYFVLGLEGHTAEIERRGDFNVWEYGRLPASSPDELSPKARRYVQAQVARGKKPDLAPLRRRAERAGVPPAALDALEAGDKDQFRRLVGDLSLEMLTPLHAFFEAVTGATESFDDFVPTKEERAEIEEAREKHYLQKLAKVFSRIVDRAEALEPLSVRDEGLYEATECYFFGFYRASVVMAASVVECHLKRVAGAGRTETYGALIDAVVRSGALGAERAVIDAARAVFELRNEVVHEARPVDPQDARLILEHSRMLTEHLFRWSASKA